MIALDVRDDAEVALDPAAQLGIRSTTCQRLAEDVLRLLHLPGFERDAREDVERFGGENVVR